MRQRIKDNPGVGEVEKVKTVASGSPRAPVPAGEQPKLATAKGPEHLPHAENGLRDSGNESGHGLVGLDWLVIAVFSFSQEVIR